MEEKSGKQRFKGDSVLWNGDWVTLRSLLTTLPPEEFAALATFLASEKAAYITGQAIAVDGGYLRGI